jgi:hypothetical protein
MHAGMCACGNVCSKRVDAAEVWAAWSSQAHIRRKRAGEMTMSTNALVFGWDRPIPGREKLSAAHFNDLVAYLEGKKKTQDIASYDILILSPYGASFNGCFLIRADNAKLDTLIASPEWVQHIIRATLHLEGVISTRAATGNMVMERMEMWAKALPS